MEKSEGWEMLPGPWGKRPPLPLLPCWVRTCVLLQLGTIPPIKSAQGEGDDVKKLFTIACPVILATLGVALLFVVRKKRKEKRLKRLRGELAWPRGEARWPCTAPLGKVSREQKHSRP